MSRLAIGTRCSTVFGVGREDRELSAGGDTAHHLRARHHGNPAQQLHRPERLESAITLWSARGRDASFGREYSQRGMARASKTHDPNDDPTRGRGGV